MYINYNIVSGIEYGTLTSSVRSGTKVSKGDQIYLGRVIDKDKGIFKSRERGLFTYDLKTNTFGKVPPEYIEPRKERKTKYPKRPGLIVSFGDIYVLNQYISNKGFYDAVDQIGYRNIDTLHALLAYYILSPHAGRKRNHECELSSGRLYYLQSRASALKSPRYLVPGTWISRSDGSIPGALRSCPSGYR